MHIFQWRAASGQHAAHAPSRSRQPVRPPAPCATVQRTTTGAQAATNTPPGVFRTLAQLGQPLDSVTRSQMRHTLGHDFGQVRVHADQQAAASTRAIGARAYTVGQDIAFGAGQFAPHTLVGQRLLAHELAHVAQQRNVSDESLAAHAALPISQPGDAAEVEADRIASGALPASQATPTNAQIARAPAGSATPPDCTGLDRSGIELSVQMAVAAISITPDSALRWLYRSLKWMRTCFAPFTEKDFQTLVPVTKFYPDDRRKEIAKNYSTTIVVDD
ncbi:MAG: DUF4157 domain-containing protein, partial [Caldilinea sp.]